MAAIKVPDELKQDLPQSSWGKIIIATPVVMTVVATLLAGLANSEMTKAQYERSLGAQMQSKAGDQWGFFQAKRLRSSIQVSTLEIIGATVSSPNFDANRLLQAVEQLPNDEAGEAQKKPLLALLNSTEGKSALHCLSTGSLPSFTASFKPSEPIAAVQHALELNEESPETNALVSKLSDKDLNADLAAARAQVKAFDELTKPVNQALAKLSNDLQRLRADGLDGGQALALSTAKLRYEAQRYEAEARLNQQVAGMLELQVRKANLSSERHHRRSQKFFFGMLGAQFGAIASTFAIATQKRNLLWGLAAAAGFLSLSMAGYVYLFV